MPKALSFQRKMHMSNREVLNILASRPSMPGQGLQVNNG